MSTCRYSGSDRRSRLDEEFGLDHALASTWIYTDGSEVPFDYAEHDADDEESAALRLLVVARNGQTVFNEVVESYLRRLDFDDDGYPRLIRLLGAARASRTRWRC